MSPRTARPPRRSAGLLVWRARPAGPEVLLGHPGGPYFTRKDDGVWSLPKGEYEPDEEPLAAAYREFAEEIGRPAPEGPAVPLGEVRLRSGKLVVAWAVEGDLDVTVIDSNVFDLPWPPGTGRTLSIPELDRADWFDLATARRKVSAGQVPLLDRFAALQAGPA